MESRIGPTRPAAEPVVIEFHQIAIATQDDVNREVCILNVAQMTGVLDGHGWPFTPRLGQILDPLFQPLMYIEHPRAESGSLLCTEEMAVVLELGTTPGGVHQDGSLSGHRSHRSFRQGPGVVGQAGVNM